MCPVKGEKLFPALRSPSKYSVGHHWVSASSFLYLLGINRSFIRSFCEVHNVFRDGCVCWCISQWHSSKAICIAIFLVLDLCLRVLLYA